MTTIKKCTCKNAYQDFRYGDNMRVHNKMAGDTPKFRCSVCGKEQGGETKKK